MLIFNGKKYAQNNGEFVDSLFQNSGTCNGYYKKVKDGIKLFRLDEGKRALAAFIKDTNTGGFIVTAHIVDGKARYLFSTCSRTEKWLGINDLGYTDLKDACTNALNTLR